MITETNNFEEYMDNFKKLTLKEKQKTTIEQLKILNGLASEMCETLDVKSESLFNKEILDLNKENYTEDDYAEAIVVYINSLQNYLCDFCIKWTEENKK